MAIPGCALSRLAAGAALPWRAVRLLAGRPSLWPYAMLPALLALAGLAMGLLSFWPLSARLLSLAWTEPAGLLSLAWTAARLALFLAMLFGASVALPVAFSAPVCDRLSARVEAVELGTAGEGGLSRLLAETAVATGHALARLALLALGQLLLLPLLLLPGGAVLQPALAFLWGGAWLAFEYMDLPMARHLHGFAEVRSALRRIRPLGLGFGCTLALLFVVPLANLFLAPVGAVAGTLLYCDLSRAGLLPPPPGSSSSRKKAESSARPEGPALR
jgi:CysZ protein